MAAHVHSSGGPETVIRARAATTHALQAILEAALISALLVGLVAGTVLAAKGGAANAGGGKAPSTLSVVVLDGPDTIPNHGERITFDVTTTATDRPFVGLKCWQGTTGVYNSSIGVFPSYLYDPWLTLDSQYWTAGVDASCTARLYYYDKRGNQKVLATLDVTVAP